MFFLFTFFTLLNLVSGSTLPDDAAYAFKAVFGTKKPYVISEIEAAPQQYCHQRAQFLTAPAATLPHIDFCNIYVAEAKACMRNHIQGTTDLPWYCKDLNAISAIIRSVLSEDDAAFPTTMALYYGCACDSTIKGHTDAKLNTCLKTEDSLKQDLLQFIEKSGKNITPQLNIKICWRINSEGATSMLDKLIMRTNGHYLCSAPPSAKRHSFSAHHGRFQGWAGIILLEPIGHASNQERHATALRNLSISDQQYFDACWDAQALPKNQIKTLSQKIQGCFYNFHALPAVQNSFNPKDPQSVIFPTSRYLTDADLFAITPYFMPAENKPSPLSDFSVHSCLLTWRDLACSIGWTFLPLATPPSAITPDQQHKKTHSHKKIGRWYRTAIMRLKKTRTSQKGVHTRFQSSKNTL